MLIQSPWTLVVLAHLLCCSISLAFFALVIGRRAFGQRVKDPDASVDSMMVSSMISGEWFSITSVNSMISSVDCMMVDLDIQL